MRILLVGNYPPDGQQSMLRFGAMLGEPLQRRGLEVSFVAPQSSGLARALQRKSSGAAAKWLGYFDKYILFPRHLARHVARNPAGSIVHVVDHSNAVYVPRSRSGETPWVVTCHDLLAVRGALGEDTDCPASALGRRLQRAITRGLARASAIACDSTSTLRDVERLVPTTRAQLRPVILLGLNHPYGRIAEPEARSRLSAINDVPWAQPFVLHVGSNLARKNKAGVLRVFARVADRWPGNLVFCGAELPGELRAAAGALGVAHRVFAAPGLDNRQLEAAYTLAHAMIYPSKCEGFGWPIIEAQACGCPVVCSDRTSLPEVGGAAAFVHALDDEAGMADSVLRLTAPACRTDVVSRGQANLARFRADRMIDAYAALYEEVLAGSGSPRR
jgi:glycosyltransferase involved in cell wall biosynthesis